MVSSTAPVRLGAMNTGNLPHRDSDLVCQGPRAWTGYKYVYDNKGWYFATHCDRLGICIDTVRISAYTHHVLGVAGPLDYATASTDGSSTLLEQRQYSHPIPIDLSMNRTEQPTICYQIPPAPAGQTCWGQPQCSGLCRCTDPAGSSTTRLAPLLARTA